MTAITHAWPFEAFEAIRLWIPDGRLTVLGSNSDQIELVDEYGLGFNLEPAERWLQMRLWDDHQDDAFFTLRLPMSKAWFVDITIGRGKVEIKDIQARMQVMLGKGELRITDCRGKFNLINSSGSVELERCSEADMPERPPLPQPVPDFPSAPFRNDFGIPEAPNFRRMRNRAARDWFEWDPGEWTAWGLQIGERAFAWAQQFSDSLGHFSWHSHKAGINLFIAKGDGLVKEINGTSCGFKLAKGDLDLETGRIGNLDINLANGDLKCSSVVPDGEWTLQSSNGDLFLALPADARARLDVATRHGDIRSKVPLVRVSRPGPEARRGGRMVGSLGPTEGKISHVSLATMHGDIFIDLQGITGSNKSPAVEGAPTETYPPPPSGSNPIEDEPIPPENGPALTSSIPHAADSLPPSYDSQLDILQALSDGAISVEEAERLLRSLGA